MQNVLSNIIKKAIKEICSPILQFKNTTSYLDLFNNVMILSVIILLFIMIWYICTKNFSLKTFFMEYKKCFKNLFFIYILNYICFFLIEKLNLNLAEKQSIFKTNSVLDYVELLIFCLFIIFLYFKQLEEVLTFLLLVAFSPIIVFQHKYETLKSKLYKLIISNLYISLSIYVISSLDVSSLWLIIILFLILTSEKSLWPKEKKEVYEFKTINV